MLRALSIAAQLVVLALAAYTLVTALWGLPDPEPAPRGRRKRRFRVVIPAHNEEMVIASVLDDLDAQRYPSELVRVAVLADRCTDRTVDLASGRAEVAERYSGADGKGAMLAWYLGRRPLDPDEALVVLDADNRVDDDLLARFADELDRGHEALQAYLDVANPDASPLASASALSYWASNRMVQLSRDRLGWGAELGGTGMCLTGGALDKAGGFSASETEDQDLTARLLLAGVRVRWLHDVRVSDEKPETLDVMVRQRTRWAGGKRLVGRSATGPLLGRWLREGSMAPFDLALRINQPGRSMVAAVSGLLTVVAAIWPSVYLLPWWVWGIATVVQVGAPIVFLARDEVPARYLWRYPYLAVFAALSPVAKLLSRRSTGWYHTPHRG
jgi:cellulose synthase/poly-beta-1,6-N-acetylglucosamine synthase-like glycosyltransferase